MRTYKKIVETTYIDENNKIEKTKTTTKHTIKTWDELTIDEKDKEIEKHNQDIYSSYQDYMYDNFIFGLDNLQCEFKNIEFDNVYMDSNSQGWWIDSIKNFRYCDNGIDVFGEHIDIYDVDFKIRRTIESFDIDIYEYYIDSDKLDRIKATKKYQKWEENIRKDIEKWVDRVNELCIELGDAEYHTPYNLNNDDKYFLDMYFEDMEFENYEIIESEGK